MKCTTVIDPDKEEAVWIYAHRRTDLVEEIERLVEGSATELIGYKGEEIALLKPADICCICVEDGKIYAQTVSEKWQLRQRLYVLEALLDRRFVKINQSCIANIKRINRFEASFAGALIVIFQNGYKDYVSRRQLKTVKERIGFTK